MKTSQHSRSLGLNTIFLIHVSPGTPENDFTTLTWDFLYWCGTI